MFIETKLEGFNEVMAKIQELKTSKIKRVVRISVKAGLAPVLNAAKSNAMGMVGGVMGMMLSMSMRIRPFRRQRSMQFGMNVQISKDYGNNFVHITKKGLRHYIPAAIQYGHAKRGRTQKAVEDAAIARRKWFGKKAALTAIATEWGSDRVPAIPFMRNAFEISKQSSIQEFTASIQKELKL